MKRVTAELLHGSTRRKSKVMYGSSILPGCTSLLSTLRSAVQYAGLKSDGGVDSTTLSVREQMIHIIFVLIEAFSLPLCSAFEKIMSLDQPTPLRGVVLLGDAAVISLLSFCIHLQLPFTFRFSYDLSPVLSHWRKENKRVCVSLL